MRAAVVCPPKFVFSTVRNRELTAHRCQRCEGLGGEVIHTPATVPGEKNRHEYTSCPDCNGTGYHKLDGKLPTLAPPGTVERMAVYMARYKNGLPIFNKSDSDHGCPLSARYQWTFLRHETAGSDQYAIREAHDEFGLSDLDL